MFVDSYSVSMVIRQPLVSSIIGKALSASVGLAIAELTKPCTTELTAPLFEAHYVLYADPRATVHMTSISLDHGNARYLFLSFLGCWNSKKGVHGMNTVTPKLRRIERWMRKKNIGRPERSLMLFMIRPRTRASRSSVR